MKAAIWVRVSTADQETDNQIPDIERYAAHHGLAIARRYELSDASAYKGEHRETLDRMLEDARRGEFSVLVVWAADRLTREGIEALLKIIRQLRERRVTLASIQEPWLSGSDATTELLVAIAGWVANQESVRRSERVKAGIARRKAAGLPVGRRQGARDSRPRRTSGYLGNRNAAA